MHSLPAQDSHQVRFHITDGDVTWPADELGVRYPPDAAVARKRPEQARNALQSWVEAANLQLERTDAGGVKMTWGRLDSMTYTSDELAGLAGKLKIAGPGSEQLTGMILLSLLNDNNARSKENASMAARPSAVR